MMPPHVLLQSRIPAVPALAQRAPKRPPAVTAVAAVPAQPMLAQHRRRREAPVALGALEPHAQVHAAHVLAHIAAGPEPGRTPVAAERALRVMAARMLAQILARRGAMLAPVAREAPLAGVVAAGNVRRDRTARFERVAANLCWWWMVVTRQYIIIFPTTTAQKNNSLTSHRNGRSSECVRMCTVNAQRRAKARPHAVHLCRRRGCGFVGFVGVACVGSIAASGGT